MIKLYSYFRSSCSYRVRIALALKGVTYETIPINLAPAVLAQKSTHFADVNLLSQVPVLEFEHGGELRRLSQSVAIISYLDQRFPAPALLPDDAWLRAQALEAVEVVNAGIQPLQNQSMQLLLQEHAGHAVNARFREHSIRTGLQQLERLAQTREGPFFAGQKLSLADVFIVPQLYSAHRYHIDVAAFSRLREIETHANALPAFQAAAPEHQPDVPSPSP